ncbi:unnamed protein product [Darwinula stevensoni]|uniref:Limulus clotting factor C n=1 Tax=Darwinula stevensoni TaxID=69355 RepID=A0A7R9A9W5_9CRUS|nr:unnamed protein product [Darwinula stevensoni]CAG0897855.1 unnamed protein product [Darwinula stevensoni]
MGSIYGIASLPAFKSDSLEELHGAFHSIRELTFDTWATPKLRIFKLYYCKIEAVRIYKSNSLEEIEELRLSNNIIWNMEFDRRAFPKLRKLWLDQNALTSDPAFKSDTLEELYLYNNRITNLEFDRWEISKLRILWLQNNQLTSLPAFKCDGLEELYFDGNDITRVEFERWETPNLRILSLKSNALTSLPAFKSDSLENLNFDGNKITNVEFGKWATPKLKKLELQNNMLTSIPAFNSDSLSEGFPFKSKESNGPWAHTIVDLKKNRIAKIDGRSLHGILKDLSHGDGFLRLDDNPILCDCVLSGLTFSPESFKKAGETGCGLPPRIKYGRFHVLPCSNDEQSSKNGTECIKDGRYLIGSKVNYKCRKFYTLRGPRIRTCGENGEWTGPDPLCEPECGRIKNPVASAQRLVRGGKVAARGAWPWQAGIYDDHSEVKDIICGGVLIGRQWVLTAAHCVVEGEDTIAVRDVNDFLVYLGKHHRNTSLDDEFVQKLKVTQIIVHDQYTGFESDIALMKLHDSANITKWVQLICLPFDDELSDQILDGVQVKGGPHRGYVTGWGIDASNRGTDVLTQVQLAVITKEECRNKISEITAAHPDSISRNTFCAGEQNYSSSFVEEQAKEYRTVCKGDSGSPMVFASLSLLKSQWVVEGIVSHIYERPGQNCSNYEPGQYGVFTRVNK